MTVAERAAFRRLERKLAKIERALQRVIDQIDPKNIERARELRKSNPGSCGEYMVSHARLCDLVDALTK